MAVDEAVTATAVPLTTAPATCLAPVATEEPKDFSLAPSPLKWLFI